ncbi:MAG: mechanosensitive ion channel [Alphaproteobacteria bacterium]|nr:mechanosensitive ion channel [Alphaproteobacteria bacterium]
MKRILFLFVFMFGFINIAIGQVSDKEFNLTQSNKILDKIFKELEDKNITRKQTANFIEEITNLKATLILKKSDYNIEFENLEKKILALGEKTDKTEPIEIAKQREEFATKIDKVKTQIAQIDLQLAKIDEINGLVLKIRNQQLLDNILVKQSSIFHPEEFWYSIVKFSEFIFELVKSPLNWHLHLDEKQKNIVSEKIYFMSISILLMVLIAIVVRFYIKKFFGYNDLIIKPNYSQKISTAIGMFVVYSLIPITIFLTFMFWFNNLPLLNDGAFGILVKNTVLYIFYYYLLKSFFKIIFSPYESKWRIIEIDNEKAKTIYSVVIFSSFLICVVSFFQNIANKINYDASIVYSIKIFANAVKAFCIILIARKTLYTNKTLSDDEIKNEEIITELSTSSKLSLFIIFSMIIAFMFSLFGYIRLSEFIINRFIYSIIVIGLFYIFDKLIRAIIHQIMLLKVWVKTFRINRRSLVKTEFWIGLLLSPIMWIVAILVLLAIWGVSVDLLIAKAKGIFIGFNIGGVHISISSILLGVLSFFVLLSLFKMLKNSFINGKLSHIEMNDGLRNSVVSSIGFLGFIVSGILAIAIMGGSLTNIAFIAGALSFGVGLGLQNMVSNLAAGLTILWARPIKIGDWVVINGLEGVVSQINMRSTEIKTWDKSTAIIPNSDILSKSLINYTYSGRIGRVVIKVGVDYNNDVKKVKEALLNIVNTDDKILQIPAPSVNINGVTDGNLIFQLICFTDNVFNRASISNDLRENIIDYFRKMNVTIYFI